MPVELTSLAYLKGLCFGVPLEDVFPSGEIHPSLKDLIFETYKNILKSCYDVEYVLSRLQGSLQERLKLKQRLALRQEIARLQISPGAPLWVLRHFLGLLPLPLLPQYTNGKKYIWKDLSTACKISLTEYVTRGRNNYELIKKLAQELLQLPAENFLLAATLFNFLRMMSVLPKGEPKINKNALFALVKYFSSSLFLRPFRPGWVTRIDKQYYPLFLYLVLKWPDIRKICLENSRYSFELPIEEIYSGYRKTSQPPEHPYYLSKRSNNSATQTAFLREVMPENKKHEEEEEVETLIRIVPPSYNDFSYLKDIGCQTDNFKTEDKEDLANTNFSITKPGKGGVETQVIFLRRDCCCTYSFNYEKDDPCEENEDTDSYTDRSTSPKNTLKYGWDLNEILDSKSTSPTCSSTSEFVNSTNYSYDNYSKFDLICDAEETNLVYEKIKLCDPVEKEGKQNHNEALKERISKVGWTYTSPIKDKTPCESNEVTPKQFSEPKADQYLLYYDMRKSLNEELKKKLNKLQIKEESDTEVEDLERSSSRLNLSEDASESKKSVISVGRIKSKLDFLRVFNTKRVKTRKSASYEQMTSKVKYEKMGSVSSIL